MGVTEKWLAEKAERAEILVLFIGANYVNSDWCLFEWAEFQKRLGEQALQRLLIIELEKDVLRQHAGRLNGALGEHAGGPERETVSEAAMRAERLEALMDCIRSEFFYPDGNRVDAYMEMHGEWGLAQPFIDKVKPLADEVVEKLLREYREDRYDADGTALSRTHLIVKKRIRADLRSSVSQILKDDEGIELRGEIRCGELSQVFEGYDGKNKRRVAVKVIIRGSRLNAVCGELGKALERAWDQSEKSSSLIDIWAVRWHEEPRYVVMPYMELPSLKKRLEGGGGKPPVPELVARILSNLAEAQGAAHARGLPLGPLSPRDIYVNDDWEIRISPFRLEALLMSRLGLADGFPFRWATLSRLPPELYDGQQPTSATYDRTGQYHLGLLGLELLRGSTPVKVLCLADLERMRAFYRDPLDRRVLVTDPTASADAWFERSPALAFVISKLLERDPAKRFASAKVAASELKRIADGQLPRSVTDEVRSGYSSVVDSAFAARFYCRLFKAGNGERLERLFSKRSEDQHVTAGFHISVDHHVAFTRALRGIDSYDPEGHPPLAEVFDRHPGYRVTTVDVESFRAAFLDEISATFSDAPRQREAWNVVLHRPLMDLCSRLG